MSFPTALASSMALLYVPESMSSCQRKALARFKTSGSTNFSLATKAQAAAEVICTTSTSTLNAVRSAGIAIVAAFTAANLKATIAVGAVAAGNFLLAAAAKVAAVAMMALSAVMSFVAAHPVAIALIALTAVLAGVYCAVPGSKLYGQTF